LVWKQKSDTVELSDEGNMTEYYNPHRKPVNVTLRTGEPAVVQRNSTLVVTPEEDRSPSLLSRCAKGLLQKLPEKDASPSEVDPEEEPQLEEKSESESEVSDKEIEVVEVESEVPEEAGGGCDEKWTVSQLLEYAADKGYKISATRKADIWDSIIEQGG
jgi:hypothetical protein